MSKNRFKKICTKAAGILLSVMVFSTAFSSMVMADEVPVASVNEQTIEYSEEQVPESVESSSASEEETTKQEEIVFDSILTEKEESTDIQPETAPEETAEESEDETAAAEEETELQEEESSVAVEENQDTEVDIPAEEMSQEVETAPETEPETEPEDETASESETEPETDLQEDQQDPYGDVKDSVDQLSGMDFSSMRLIIATSDDSIFVEPESVIGSFGDIYLLQFTDEETAMKAYLYYQNKADLVDVDTGIQICEGEAAEDVSTGNIMSEGENPLSELEAAMAEGTAYYDIALIDTGASGANITGAVSMIGDDPSDNNGHGTQMAAYMAAENGNVSILSIKALGADGKGDISAVYAAIEYAISQNVKVINLSASAYASSDNLILRDVIRKATSEGIIVVGAAGNNGKNAAYYVPGNIWEALIIGAADESGLKLDISNYGDTVDYNVAASSTSEAAARMSGWLSLNRMEDLEAVLNEGFVFETNYQPSEEGNEDPQDPDDSFTIDKTWPTQTSNPVAGITLNSSIEWSGMDAWWPDSNGLITRSAAWTAVGEVGEISKLKPGDVIVWADWNTTYWANHIAIVTEVASDYSYFVTADGNCANETGLAITTRTDFLKSRSTYGKVLVWRNTVNGAAIAKYVDLFTKEMIKNNDTSMATQWSNINWCYCFVVAALLDVEELEEYGHLKVTKEISTPNGSIKISKTTSDAVSDKDVAFTFTLKVTNTSGNAVTTKFNYSRSDGTTGTISGNGGTVKLKHGQNVVISGIPQGYSYTVTETKDPSYTTTVSKNGGTVSAGNSVSGTIPAAAANQSFSFTVNIKNGSKNVSGLKVASDLTTNSSGNVTFTLTPGSSGSASKTLSDIPEGYTYTVTESEVSGWTSSPADRTRTGTIEKDVTKSASFSNTFTPAQQTIGFTNIRVIVLPETGSSDMMWMLLIGSLLVVGGAGSAILFGKKKERKMTGVKGNAIKKAAGVIAGLVMTTMLTFPAFAAGNIEVISSVDEQHGYDAYQLLSGTNLGENTLWISGVHLG